MLRKLLLSLFSLAALSTSALAADDHVNAKIIVVHGIDGRDVTGDQALPVDVALNGGCALADFTFGTITNPIGVPAGDYTVDISLAGDNDDTCENPAVITANITLAEGEVATIVAHLAEDGSLTASKFAVDPSPTPFLATRALVHHTAAAPSVDLLLDRVGILPYPDIFAQGLTNGGQLPVETLFGFYRATVFLNNTSTVALGPASGFLLPGRVHLAFVVGSAANGTLSIISRSFRLP